MPSRSTKTDSPALANAFRDHLDIALGAIQNSPELYPVVHRDVRRRLVERFPYIVFYCLYPALSSSSLSCTLGRTPQAGSEGNLATTPAS